MSTPTPIELPRVLPDAPSAAQDEYAMRLALDQALNAQLVGEVPVGAVIMHMVDGVPQVIATGYNRPITTHDPTAHAEIVALRHAAQLLGNYRLPDCTLYVTLEPCAMCAMALMHARLGARRLRRSRPEDRRRGFGVEPVRATPSSTTTRTVQGGVLADAAGALLRDFFAERRAAQQGERASLARRRQCCRCPKSSSRTSGRWV